MARITALVYRIDHAVMAGNSDLVTALIAELAITFVCPQGVD